MLHILDIFNYIELILFELDMRKYASVAKSFLIETVDTGKGRANPAIKKFSDSNFSLGIFFKLSLRHIIKV